MRIPALCALVTALLLPCSAAWSQEAETDAKEPAKAAVGQSEQEKPADKPRMHRGMMKGHHCMGAQGMKHGGKGAVKGHEMKHGHHQQVLQRLERIEKRQILIETMLRQLLLDKTD